MTSQDLSAAPSPRMALWIRVVLCNIPLLFGLIGLQVLPEVLQPFFIGLIMLIVPGLVWTDMRERDFMAILFRILVVSVIASTVAWLIAMVLPGPTLRVVMVGIIAVIVNVGLWFGAKRSYFDLKEVTKPLPAILFAIGAVFYLQSYMGAAHFVPALEDQDMEFQGTAYGIIHAGEPAMVTNRHTRFYFTHPLLLHFWIGEGALFTDTLDNLKPYYDESMAAKEPKADREALYMQSLHRFETEPHLLTTRAPNVFLSFLVIFPIGFLAYRMSGSLIAAAGSTILYATLPEVYVRSSYGGYMTVSNMWMTFSAYFYLRTAGLHLYDKPAPEDTIPNRNRTFWASFMSVISDHKGMVMPMATTAHTALRYIVDNGLKVFYEGGIKGVWKRFITNIGVVAGLALGLGFVVGWAVYCIYGFSIDPGHFYYDHLRDHVIGRMRGDKLNFIGEEQMRADATSFGNFVYPSTAGLWLEFATHHGWLIMLAFVPAFVHGARQITKGLGLFVIWFLIGAIGFSLVDWRQTKHLAHLLPAMTILIMVYWSTLKGRLQQAFSALLVIAIVYNIYRVGLEMHNFEYIKPLPIW